MDSSLSTEFLLLLILICVSGFFSGSETALTAVSRARMYALEQAGSARAALVRRLRERKDTLISTLLIGNTFVNIACASLATVVFLRLFGADGALYATILTTVMLVIFGEVLPKTVAIYHADRFALFVAPVVNVLVRALSPLTHVAQSIVRAMLRMVRFNLDHAQHVTAAAEAIRGTIELHHEEGEVVKKDRDMLGSILDLSQREVGEVMIHRKQVESIDLAEDPETIIAQAIALNHSRIPLWKDNMENIVGILHMKDLFRLIRQQKIGITREMIRRVAQKPWFVPDTTNLADQLTAFRTKRKHFACVVDEYGAWLGIVTLEDIIEEIVGDIDDEHDPLEIAEIIPFGDRAYRVEGSVTIRDLNRRLDWDMPDEFATTVAGLVLHEARVIPEKGASFEFYGYRFTVEDKRANQITQLLIERLDDAYDDAQE